MLAVGDPSQLGSVGPGGMFSVMVDHPDLPTAELEQVWRMEAEWEKAASLRLRVMDPTAVDDYAARGGYVNTRNWRSCWTGWPRTTPKAWRCW